MKRFGKIFIFLAMLMLNSLNLAYGQDYNKDQYNYNINPVNLQASAELSGLNSKIGISIRLQPPDIQNSSKNERVRISI